MSSTLMCRVPALWEMMDSQSVNYRQSFLLCLSFLVLLFVFSALWSQSLSLLTPSLDPVEHAEFILGVALDFVLEHPEIQIVFA